MNFIYIDEISRIYINLHFPIWFMRFWIFLFIFFILSLSLSTANADDDDEDDENENELGEESGSVAAWLIVVSFVYVVVRQKITRTKLKELGITTKEYGQYLETTLKIHMWVSAIATIIAIYHTWAMIADEGWFKDDVLTGYIPLVAMIYLTLSGILLWKKLPNDWVNRVLRKKARQVHVQRWITVIFIIGLLIHVA